MIVKNKKELKKIKNLTSRKFDISNYEIKDFKEGWNVIIDKGTKKEGLISEDYTKLIKPIFDECFLFQEGFASFEKDKKKYWIDKDGNIYTENPY